MSKRTKAYRDLETLVELSAASPRTFTQDEYGVWTMAGERGHVYADRKGFVIYVFAGEEGRRWSRAKRDLAFCSVPQDYEEEGCFRLDRMPTKAEAVLTRQTIEARRRGPSDGSKPLDDPIEVYLPAGSRNQSWSSSTGKTPPDSSVKRGSRAKSPRPKGLFWDSLGPLEVAQMGISGPGYVLDAEAELDHPDWRPIVSKEGVPTLVRRIRFAKPPKPVPHCLVCGTAVNPAVRRFCSTDCREAFDDGAKLFSAEEAGAEEMRKAA